MSTQGSAGQSVPLNSLLRIDIRAGIRKLSDAQLQGSWQLGAECVRLAVQCKANQIKIVTGRRKFSMIASQARLRPERLGDLAKVLDTDLSPHARHAALERLESCAHPVLLVLLSQSIHELTMTVQHPKERRRLDWKRGQKPRHLRQSKAHDHYSLKVELKIDDLDRRALTESLHELCRFCSIPIKVDGRSIAASLPPGLGQCRVQEPIPGVITLPDPGAGSRVWLLQNGVIRANLSLPARPWFAAALELSSKVAPDATPADLRHCFERELPNLIDVSIGLLQDTVQQERAPHTLASLRHWVLEAARVPHLLRQVETLRVFPFHPPRKDSQLRSLADLAEDLVPAPLRGSLQAPTATIDPLDLATRVHHDTPLIEIETRAQPLLCELMQHRYSAAPAIARSPALRSALAKLRARHRAGGGLRKALGRAFTRSIARFGPKRSPSQLPAPLRRAYQELLERPKAPTRIVVTAWGRVPVWRGQVLVLPLRCPELQHWAALDESRVRAKDLLWSSLCALRRP